MGGPRQSQPVLRVGHFYTVAGNGPMQVLELPDPSPKDPRWPASGPRKVTVTLRQPGGTTYWAAPDQIVDEVHEWWFVLHQKPPAELYVLLRNGWQGEDHRITGETHG